MDGRTLSAQPNEAPIAKTQLVGAKRGRLEKKLGLPPRPKKVTRTDDTAWMLEAVCASAPDADRVAFVHDGLQQATAWPLVESYCDRCPVARHCLEDGRRSHLTGLAGGIVLQDGYLASDRSGSPYLTADAWSAPWAREEYDAPLEQVDIVGRARHGITAKEAAVALLGASGARGRTEVGRRHLTALERAGQLRKEAAVVGSHPARWWALEGSVPAG